jgi:hypothetical protein
VTTPFRFRVKGKVALQKRSWSYETQVTAQNIPKLGQLIKAGTPQPYADSR